jgi:hypothetical protein
MAKTTEPKFKVGDKVTCILYGNEVKTIEQVVPRPTGYGYVIEGAGGPMLCAERTLKAAAGR